jgi:hypothetical protein
MKPNIKICHTLNGDVEAFISPRAGRSFYTGRIPHLILDPRTDTVLSSTVAEGTDEFRWLVTAAREWVRQ